MLTVMAKAAILKTTQTRSFRCRHPHPETGHCRQRFRPDAYGPRSAWPTLLITSSASPGSRGEVRPHSRKTGCRGALRPRKPKEPGPRRHPSRPKNRDQTPRAGDRPEIAGSSRCPIDPDTRTGRHISALAAINLDLLDALVKRRLDAANVFSNRGHRGHG